MRFDEEPDGDIHGECAFEIKRLQGALTAAETREREAYERAAKVCAALPADMQPWECAIKIRALSGELREG